MDGHSNEPTNKTQPTNEGTEERTDRKEENEAATGWTGDLIGVSDVCLMGRMTARRSCRARARTCKNSVDSDRSLVILIDWRRNRWNRISGFHDSQTSTTSHHEAFRLSDREHQSTRTMRLNIVVVWDWKSGIVDCSQPVLDPGPKNVNFEPRTHLNSSRLRSGN